MKPWEKYKPEAEKSGPWSRYGTSVLEEPIEEPKSTSFLPEPEQIPKIAAKTVSKVAAPFKIPKIDNATDLLDKAVAPFKTSVIDTPVSRRLAGDVTSGMVSDIEGGAGALKWMGADRIGNAILKRSAEIQKDLRPENPNFIDTVAQGFGSTVPFYLPGLGVAAGAQKLASIAPRLATWFGIGTSSILEALVESGSGYNESMTRSPNEDEAKTVANKVFWANIPLLLATNKLGLGGDKVLWAALGEGSQEATQEVINNIALHDPMLEDAFTSFIVGGVVGGGLKSLSMAGEPPTPPTPTPPGTLPPGAPAETLPGIETPPSSPPDGGASGAGPSFADKSFQELPVELTPEVQPKVQPQPEVPGKPLPVEAAPSTPPQEAEPEPPKPAPEQVERKPSESLMEAVESDDALNDIMGDIEALKGISHDPRWTIKEVGSRMVSAKRKLADVVDLYVKDESEKSSLLVKVNSVNSPKGMETLANSVVEKIKSQGVFDEPAKTTIQKTSGINPIRRMINIREDMALKNQIKAEARGSREGFKAGVREGSETTREQMVNRFREGRQKVSDTIEFIKNSLPVEDRGRFITAASNATSMKKHYSVFARVVEELEKKKAGELRSEIKEFSSPSDKIPVDYQKRLEEVRDGIDLSKPSADTVSKLKGLREFIAKNGEPLGISPKKLEALTRLTKKSVKDMTSEELTELRDQVKLLQNLGRLKLDLKWKYNVREWKRATQKLVASTVNMDPKATGNEKMDRAKAETLRYYMETMHTMRVADMLDGRQGYKGENVRHLKTLAQAEDNSVLEHRKKMSEFMEKGKQIKTDWTEAEMDAMAYHIYLEQKAYDQVRALISAKNLKEEPKLTPEMRKMIDLMRDVVDRNADKIAVVYEEIQNQPFEKVKNYFPIKYEKEFNLISPATIEQNRYRTSQVFKGFTFERQKEVKKIPRTDLFNILDEAISEQEWYVNMQPKLENLKYLVKSEEYAKAAGEVGQNFWKNALDIIARRGWGATAQSNFLLREGRINLQKAILGYKLSSILMQPMAIFDALAYVSATHGARASADVLGEFSKTWVNPKRAKEFISKSPALQARGGGEEAIAETFEAAKKSGHFYRVYTEKGMELLQRADIITASGIEHGVYNALLRNGLSKEEAMKEADFIMNLVSGSNNVVYRPQILSKGEGARAWFTFQNFFLNRWGIIAHDLGGGLLKGDYKKKLSSLFGLAVLMAGSIAEKEARSWVYRLISGKKPKSESALATAIMTIPTAIPFFGNLIEVAYANAHGSRMSSAPPVLKVAEDGLRGAVQMFSGKKKSTKLGGASKVAESALTLGTGIPGTSQGFDILERLFLKGRGSKSGEPKEPSEK